MINIKKIYIRSNLHTSVYTPVWNWNNTHKAVHVLTTIMQHPYFFIFHVIPFQFFPFWEERPLVWNILISEIAGPDYSYLGKNIGVGCHFLLQGIFPTQGSNSLFLHWQEDSLPLSHLRQFISIYFTFFKLSVFSRSHIPTGTISSLRTISTLGAYRLDYAIAF